MTGSNQHHIPQFFQRGFGVPRSRKPKEIWEYRKGAPPELSKIKHTAAENFFYSMPPNGEAETLDELITQVETPLSRKVHALRQLKSGTVIDAALATEILTHLAPRTAHLRSVFSQGLSGLIDGIRAIFLDENNLAALLGIDGDRPSARFHNHFDQHIKTDPLIAQIGLPQPVLEQVLFRLAKENFSGPIKEHIAQLSLSLEEMAADTPKMARDGHNNALTRIATEGGTRSDLVSYQWSIEDAPPEGAILPDCIAVAWLNGDVPRPFIGADIDLIRAITLPLSTKKLLFGVRQQAASPAAELLNAGSAACSHSFFLAANDTHVSLTNLIGETATIDLQAAMESAIGEFRCNPSSISKQTAEPPPVANEAVGESASASGNFSYHVSCRDFGDQDLVQSINSTLSYIVSELAQVLPLDRLDGITFAADYPAALSAVDRGRDHIAPATTVSREIGVGVSMTVIVERDGVTKGHIVMASGIGLNLISSNDADSQWALHLLIHELAQVSMIQLFDDAFPGVLLRPLNDRYEGRLFASVHNALDGYVAARISACFGDREQIMQTYQELLISTLTLAFQKIPKARLAYRYDGDIEKLMAVARPLVEHILSFTATLLGHADGLGSSPFDDEGVVNAALEKAGLLAWTSTFETDLRSHWDSRGQWRSLEELFRFNRHFERLFWQFGMYWSRNRDGEPRIDIPIATDFWPLMQATARGVPAPNFPPMPAED